MSIKFNNYDVIDPPTAGLYLGVDVYGTEKDASTNTYKKTKKAIILTDVDEKQKIGRMPLSDGIKLTYILSDGADADKSTDKGGDSTDTGLKTVWSVDFTINAEKSDVAEKLNKYLTAEQLADITDESAGGPNFDGKNRTIAVWFLGNEAINKMMPEPLLLNWCDRGSVQDEDMKAKLTAAGFKPMVNAPSCKYLLDGDAILNIDIIKGTKYKFRIAKLATPISNPE